MRPFSVVVLAAGESRRLGFPKQLVEYEGEPLVRRAVETALASGPIEVVVVLGSHAELVQEAIGSFTSEGGSSISRRFVRNECWGEGMGSSVRAGVAELSEEALAVVLMVCDQPGVNERILKELVGRLESGVDIAACTYGESVGVPCAFVRSLFPELLRLKGDKGARDIIRDPSRSVALVPFEDGSSDIDTVADLEKLS